MMIFYRLGATNLLDDEMNIGPYVSDGRVKVSTNIEGHVKRAFAILEMTNSQANVIPTIKQMIDADPLPTFLLSPTKQILLANDAAVAFFGLEIGRKLSGNSFPREDIEKIDHFLNILEDEKTDKVLAIIQSVDENDETTLLFALTKIYDTKAWP